MKENKIIKENIEQEIIVFFKDLMEKQEFLDEEFQKILNNNLFDLYSDSEK